MDADKEFLINRITDILARANEHELRMVLAFIEPLENKEGE